MKSYKLKLTDKDRREREANLIAVSPIYRELRKTYSINNIRKALGIQWYQVQDLFMQPEKFTLLQIVNLHKLTSDSFSISDVLMMCSADLGDIKWYELASANEDVLTKRFGSK